MERTETQRVFYCMEIVIMALTVTHMATLSSRHNRARLHTRRSPSLAEENQELSLVLLDKA
jgi:hypothetical protein